jgi:hypothetical protein
LLLQEQMAEGDPQAQQEGMLKMKTAKIRKARWVEGWERVACASAACQAPNSRSCSPTSRTLPPSAACSDPVIARKQKEAQRSLKNIKLMVTDKDEVGSD